MDLEVQKLLEKADGNFAIFDSVAKAHSVLSRYDSIACSINAQSRFSCIQRQLRIYQNVQRIRSETEERREREDKIMGFTEILTIIFIVLKLLGVITWAWWVCLLPEILAGVLYVVIVVAQLVAIHKTHKSIKKHFDEF